MKKRHVLQTSIVPLLLSVSLLGGCAPYTMVNSGLHRAGPYTLETKIDWSKRKGKPAVWTVDGEGLEFLLHFEGVGNGEKLFRNLPDEHAEVFSTGMNPTDLMSTFGASFELAYGVRAVETTRIAPASFGPWPGFRLDFVFESSIGVPMRATSIGAIVNGELHLLVYAGATAHYFDKYQQHVEDMFGSIRLR